MPEFQIELDFPISAFFEVKDCPSIHYKSYLFEKLHIDTERNVQSEPR